MAKTNVIADAAEKLWKDSSESNWKSFEKSLKSGGAKYYKVFFPKKIKKLGDLQSSYVMIYDSRYKELAKTPVTMNARGKVQGATIYLISLLNTNKDYKEWVS